MRALRGALRGLPRVSAGNDVALLDGALGSRQGCQRGWGCVRSLLRRRGGGTHGKRGRRNVLHPHQHKASPLSLLAPPLLLLQAKKKLRALRAKAEAQVGGQ